jgi:hypothetical protein
VDKMATLFTGDECWVRFTTGIDKATAQLQSTNKAGLKAGEKVGILMNDRVRLFRVEIKDYKPDDGEQLTTQQIEDLPKTIVLSDQIGRVEFVSMYWKGSGWKFIARQMFGTSKAKWSLVTTALTIIGACGAAVNSAQSATCSGIHCVTPLSGILLAVAAIAALVGWGKENFS